MRKATIVFVLTYVLIFAGVVVATSPSHTHASESQYFEGGGFGGGGGDAFTVQSSNSHQFCGAFCGAIIGWLVGKVLDYVADMPVNDPNACGGAPCGGGGGDAF